MNDLSYGTFALTQHVKLEQLERVEIIRGPGSALYGGSAELAVVNVVSRAATVQGAGFAATAGRFSGAGAPAALSAAERPVAPARPTTRAASPRSSHIPMQAGPRGAHALPGARRGGRA